ncbi:nucleoside deaminase [Paractinoplanes lichenicola]|uniref:Nucleoside deaminase n=1 Tax=Paractinoplanes lichenicola TaxID=2802976 RepID=A0ABS1VYQ4_9ACTN|nr:nucleoside deaminase [Actinoplanes lichenicola]MBL7259622.1 nucleoside deaminase [Actinoplanes lichenicola]
MTFVTSSAISAIDESYLERAVALAWDARKRGDHPFGALLVGPAGNVAEAMNSTVTQADPTGHAETNLVRVTGSWELAVLSESTLYTSTEPCAMCAGAIYWSGIGRMVFAFSSDELGAMVDDEDGVPPLRLSSREVFARGGRPIVIDGPAALASAADVHRGFWK